jgi:hypothetical protein
VTWKRLSRPGSLSTVTVPPWAWDNCLHDGEPEAGSGGIAGAGRAVKAFEEAVEVGLRYAGAVDEAVEHLRAAATLGLGVRRRSYSVRDQDDADSYGIYWELDVLTDHPVQEEDDVE